MLHILRHFSSRLGTICQVVRLPGVQSLARSRAAGLLADLYVYSSERQFERLHCVSQVVVSPDVGGVARARAFAKKLSDAPLAIVDKRRSAHNISEVMNLIGDVKDKVAVLVDDMIDTAGALPPAPVAPRLHAVSAWHHNFALTSSAFCCLCPADVYRCPCTCVLLASSAKPCVPLPQARSQMQQRCCMWRVHGRCMPVRRTLSSRRPPLSA